MNRLDFYYYYYYFGLFLNAEEGFQTPGKEFWSSSPPPGLEENLPFI